MKLHYNDIEFRFWQGTKMIYSGSICESGFQEFWENWTQSHIQDEADLMPIMQKTELEDKNKKPIYFYDILEYSFHDKTSGEEYGGTGLVVPVMGGGAGIRTEWSEYTEELVAILDGGSQEGIWNDDDLWSFEIIGNMYENKHLLMDNGAGLNPFKQ